MFGMLRSVNLLIHCMFHCVLCDRLPILGKAKQVVVVFNMETGNFLNCQLCGNHSSSTSSTCGSPLQRNSVAFSGNWGCHRAANSYSVVKCKADCIGWFCWFCVSQASHINIEIPYEHRNPIRASKSCPSVLSNWAFYESVNFQDRILSTWHNCTPWHCRSGRDEGNLSTRFLSLTVRSLDVDTTTIFRDTKVLRFDKFLWQSLPHDISSLWNLWKSEYSISFTSWSHTETLVSAIVCILNTKETSFVAMWNHFRLA